MIKNIPVCYERCEKHSELEETPLRRGGLWLIVYACVGGVLLLISIGDSLAYAQDMHK